MFLDSDDEGERYANIVAKGFHDNEEHKVQKKWIAKNLHYINEVLDEFCSVYLVDAIFGKENIQNGVKDECDDIIHIAQLIKAKIEDETLWRQNPDLTDIADEL